MKNAITFNRAVFCSTGFVFSVGLLILNDHFFKTYFHNWITGKLSDFAGLYAFSLFWIAFFPKYKRFIFFLTAFGFIWWKSEYADSFIIFFNRICWYQLEREVDLTDLIALLSLIPAWYYKQIKFTPLVPVNPTLMCFIAFLTFCATSAKEEPRKQLYRYYPINGNCKEVCNELKILSTFDIDSIYFIRINHVNRYYNLGCQVENCGSNSIIWLRSIEGYHERVFDSYEINNVIQLFEDSVIQKLTKLFPDKNPDVENKASIYYCFKKEINLTYSGGKLNGKFLEKGGSHSISGQYQNDQPEGKWLYQYYPDSTGINYIGGWDYSYIQHADYYQQAESVLVENIFVHGELVKQIITAGKERNSEVFETRNEIRHKSLTGLLLDFGALGFIVWLLFKGNKSNSEEPLKKHSLPAKIFWTGLSATVSLVIPAASYFLYLSMMNLPNHEYFINHDINFPIFIQTSILPVLAIHLILLLTTDKFYLHKVVNILFIIKVTALYLVIFITWEHCIYVLKIMDILS